MVDASFKRTLLCGSLGLILAVASCNQTLLSGDLFDGGTGDSEICANTCSNDLRSVVDCRGIVQRACGPSEGCADARCIPNPCEAARTSKSSYGCDYWALKTAQRVQADGSCFAALVSNTWPLPVHIKIQYDGQSISPAKFAYIPRVMDGIMNFQPKVDYVPYDASLGLGVGEVAVIFLSRLASGSVTDCPRPAALATDTGFSQSGIGKAFHISTDYPVTAYQFNPYGGGANAIGAATMLLPTSAWDTNYLAINAYKAPTNDILGGAPSLNIVAAEDQTMVTLLPKAAIVGGGGIAAGAANTPITYQLAAGQFLQFTQLAELTGSPIQSNKPVGVFGASSGMRVPTTQGDQDNAQQQIAPIKAMGSEYVAVRYRNRVSAMAEESVPWRLVGMVDGTSLTWEPSQPPGAPSSLRLGEIVEFNSPGPFVVRSQNNEHPFYLGGYMTGGSPYNNIGDPEWVNATPSAQYLNHYVFFTDPTFPETSLVVVRRRSKVDNQFADVRLGCMDTNLTGWQPVGQYEYTRVDLVSGMFKGIGKCLNGRQEMSSQLPFGVTVWGWGAIQQYTNNSYAYAAGAGFQPINNVQIVP